MNNQFLKLTGILSILFLSITFVNAQTTFTTNEVRQFMSRGEQNGIEVILNGTSVNEAKDGLKKLSKKYNAKLVSTKKSPEILLDNAQISTVSANTVDIYAIVTPVDKGSKVTFFTDLGGAFVTSYAYGTQHAAMEAVIKEFAQNQAVAMVSSQQKVEEKALKTLNKELKSLQKSKDKALKAIEDSKTKISKLEQEIKKNDADQTAKQQQISLQEQIIETVKTKRATLKN
jgi:ribosomal protein S11